MKKLFLFALTAVMAFGMANAQTPTAPVQGNDPAVQEELQGPKIAFTAKTHDYGTINKGADGGCVFEFTNTGNEPLILSNVRASCGCTTPEWTQKPVMPGQKGTIHVRYNTNNVGGFQKSVTVQSNAVNDPRIQLYIKGNVVAEQAPQAQ